MYTELKKALPKRNIEVKTPSGKGRVVDTHILTQLVVVEYESGEREAVGVENIDRIKQPQKGRKKQQNDKKEQQQDNKQ